MEDGLLLQVDQASAKKAALLAIFFLKRWQKDGPNILGISAEKWLEMVAIWLKMVDLLLILAGKFGFVELHLT